MRFDIEGNQREVEDALGRVVMRYDYDMLGNRIHQASMEAGQRWTLGDVTGKPIRAWDSRGHTLRTEYDALRRPIRTFVTERRRPAQSWFKKRSTAKMPRSLIPGRQPARQSAQGVRSAGVVTSDKYDVKGNHLTATRQLLRRLQAAGGLGNTVSLEDGG